MESMYLYFLCMISLTLTTDICGDYMEIGDYIQPETGTRCKEGLIAKVDNLTITAHVRPKLNTLRPWAVLDFQIYKQNNTFANSLCHLYFSGTCTNAVEDRDCYCKQNWNGTFDIILNKTAELEESRGDVFLKWRTLGSNRQRKTRRVKLPAIYQEEEEHLFVGKEELQLSWYRCRAYVLPGDVLRWCVKNLESHTLTLAFHYGEFNSTDDCVDHEVRMDHLGLYQSDLFHISYEEHEGCRRKKVHHCFWRHKDDFSFLKYNYPAIFGLLFGFGSRFLGPRFLQYLGFTTGGIRRHSKAAAFKRWCTRNQIFQFYILWIIDILQRAGHKGYFDLPLCALCAITGYFLGIIIFVLLLLIIIILFLLYFTIRIVIILIWKFFLKDLLKSFF